MTEKEKEQEKTEVYEGAVVPGGGIHRPEKRDTEANGVEPQDVAPGTLVVCRNGACGMEIMKGVDRCTYCNTKQ